MKLYRIVYNDGGWHSGGTPDSFFIAKNKDEVKEKSRAYKDFCEMRESCGGDLYIYEITNLFHIGVENGSDFEFNIKKREE